MRHIPNVRHQAALKSLLPFPDIVSYLAGEAAFAGLSPLGLGTLDATLAK